MRPEATSLLIKSSVIEEDTLIYFLPARKMASETNEAAMSPPSLLQGEIPTIPGPWSRRQTLAWLSQGPEQGLPGRHPLCCPQHLPSPRSPGRAGSREWTSGTLFLAQLSHQTQKASHRHLADRMMFLIKTRTLLCTH